MKSFEIEKNDALNDLKFYRAYENELIHRYGINWNHLASTEEITELEARKNKVDWQNLQIKR